jgi:hypothetical protein
MRYRSIRAVVRVRGIAVFTAHHGANNARKRLGRDSPADVSGGACEDRAHATPAIEPSGEDHDLRIRDPGGQLLRSSDVADARQLVVEQHDVRAMPPRQLQRRCRVGHRNDADIGPLQGVQKRIPDPRVRSTPSAPALQVPVRKRGKAREV